MSFVRSFGGRQKLWISGTLEHCSVAEVPREGRTMGPVCVETKSDTETVQKGYPETMNNILLGL